MAPLSRITTRSQADLRRALAGAHPTSELQRRLAAARP